MKVSTQLLVGLTKLWWAVGSSSMHLYRWCFQSLHAQRPGQSLPLDLEDLFPQHWSLVQVFCLQRQEQIIPTTYSDAFKKGRNVMVWNVNHVITYQQQGIELIELRKVASCFLFFFCLGFDWNETLQPVYPRPPSPRKLPGIFKTISRANQHCLSHSPNFRTKSLGQCFPYWTNYMWF